MSDENIPENVPVLPATSVRENLVATAVKFLQNPKVQSSPLIQKKEFLKKKGLTEEEINKAVQLSGATANPITPPVENRLVGPNAISPAQQPVSTWSKLRDYSALTIIVAGLVYGLYALYKKYIEPMFLRKQAEQNEKMDRMEKGITDLSSTVTKTLEALQGQVGNVHHQLDAQNLKMTEISNSLTIFRNQVNASSNPAISELQAEVTSLKALMLGSKQFPATPAVPPVIPSWQMKSNSTATTTPKQTSDAAQDPLDKEQSDVSTATTHETRKPQNRSDLETSDSEVMSDGSGHDARVGSVPKPDSAHNYANLNGHGDHNGAQETSIGLPSMVGVGLMPNHTSSMLVSPNKMGLQPSSLQERPVVGGSELD